VLVAAILATSAGYIFQQDNHSCASRWTIRRLKQESNPVLEQVGNSPNMNAIEGPWVSMRIEITRDLGAPYILE
jgi:hypothetical protein